MQIKIETNNSQVLVTSGTKVVIEDDLEVQGSLTLNNIVSTAVVPLGGIIMWSGAELNIPTGWNLCNGTNGTPDLRGRFIMSSTYGTSISMPTNEPTQTDSINVNANDTGGHSGHYMSTGDMPSHTHGIDDNGHSHTLTNISEDIL